MIHDSPKTKWNDAQQLCGREDATVQGGTGPFGLLCLYILVVSVVLTVFAGDKERTREVNDLYREMIESGFTRLGDKQDDDGNGFEIDLTCLSMEGWWV
ncbi:hypothetical protein MKW98_028944 [Papaver atlanticum]|uniref:Uncharacterized protein n=1 Tax=Papaver atlanticum TaxID=357466 RepID=A0AAD4S2V8_9MAGN|nr:hypothetical protein MKW98_028944 [Papaver atlanticum]